MHQEEPKFPLWIPPTYAEDGTIEPFKYSLEDWQQARVQLLDLVQLSMRGGNEAFTLALADAADRCGIEVERRRGRGAA